MGKSSPSQTKEVVLWYSPGVCITRRDRTRRGNHTYQRRLPIYTDYRGLHMATASGTGSHEQRMYRSFLFPQSYWMTGSTPNLQPKRCTKGCFHWKSTRYSWQLMSRISSKYVWSFIAKMIWNLTSRRTHSWDWPRTSHGNGKWNVLPCFFRSSTLNK